MAFADNFAAAPRAFIRKPAIYGGLEFSTDLFDGNGIGGSWRVIDVSGNGANKHGTPVEMALDEVLIQRIVINGLSLLLKPRLSLYTGGDRFTDYCRDCVISGKGAFVIPVTERNQMVRATRRKLLCEISVARPRLEFATGHAPRAKVDLFISEKHYRSWEQE